MATKKKPGTTGFVFNTNPNNYPVGQDPSVNGYQYNTNPNNLPVPHKLYTGPGDVGLLTSQPTIPTPRPDAGYSYLPTFATGGGATPTLNGPPANYPAPRPTSSGGGWSGLLAKMNPFANYTPKASVDPLEEYAKQLAGQVGNFPGPVNVNIPDTPNFPRWQRPTDLSGIFDPIQAEYTPVIETLYNNLQGSVGNIQKNLEQGWQDTRGSLEGQWAGVNQDQAAAAQAQQDHLNKLAIELGVPPEAMMADPNLQRFGMENERLKQLNQTLQANSMGTLNTLAESQSQGIGAYGPALQAAQGQSLADMAMTLAGEKGQLGSDLLNLESQHNTAMAEGEMALRAQLAQIARDNAERDYARQVKGWEMRQSAATEAQKAAAESASGTARDKQMQEFMKQMQQGGEYKTTAENTAQWNAFMQDLSPQERNALNELYAQTSSEKSILGAAYDASTNYPQWLAQQTVAGIPSASKTGGFFGKALAPIKSYKKAQTSKSAQAKALQAAVARKLIDAGPALMGGLGMPSNVSSSTNSGFNRFTQNY